jgi:hypothetical protein
MTLHTVVGVYDAEADAAATVRDLQAAAVPPASISQHTKANFGGTDFSSANAITHKQGFWGHLFGTAAQDDSDAYNRSIERGSTVVSVRASEENVDRVSEIMESHGPIDLEDESAEDASSPTSLANADSEDAACVRCYVVDTYVVETIDAEQQRKPKL